jgi:hypothetical protein
VNVLRDSLSEPTGIVLDPLRTNRVFVAERSAPGLRDPGRVIAFSLDTKATTVVHVRELGVVGSGLPRPSALALERGGARLLVLTDADPGDGSHELRGADLGGPELGEVFEIAAGIPGAASLATGPDGLRLLALSAANDLAAGGGVEQVRAVVAYEAATQVATVEPAFSPALQVGRGWSWSKSPTALFRAAPGGANGVVTWDSEEALGGGLVDLRLSVFDSDAGAPQTSAVSKAVRSALDSPPVHIGGVGSFTTVVSADVDRDGLPDLIVIALRERPPVDRAAHHRLEQLLARSERRHPHVVP